MGSAQSTNTTPEIKEIPRIKETPPCSVGGRKQSDSVLAEEPKNVISMEEASEETGSIFSSDDGYESDGDSEEEENEDEEWNERLAILEDAHNLRKFAEFYLFPQSPLVVEKFAMGRNFFTRFDAPNNEETEEHERILADAAALKQLAIDYMHPELPVKTTDAFACGRNYFARPSTVPFEEDEEAQERAQILADAAALKQLAIDYLHPELPVKTTDAFVCGRNYFSRPSAVPFEEDEEAQERAQILADAAALKQLAIDYMHPELPVKTTDAFVCGRNYFARPSAVPFEEDEEAQERAQILADAAALKQLAIDYMHPELPVKTTDAFVCGRNYFARPSAVPFEEDEEAQERAQILADAAALKQLAIDYMHPELPVKTTDAFACSRNYFSRPSAVPFEEDEEAQERAQILADAAALKQLAIDYMHPELPVKTTDAFACSRNYFSRPSAVPFEEDEEAQERAQILADAAALKQLAIDYMHPELPVKTTDAFVCGRNYFARPSAVPFEEDEEAQERAQILADAAALKQLAIDYLHPELPVKTTDAFAYGRNYFSRASAAGHTEQIHTEGYVLSSQGLTSDHQYYYHDHVDDHMHDDHHDQSDHFEMDEDMAHEFQEFRQSLKAVAAPIKDSDVLKEDEEGKLSRSPSSVMLDLFDEEPVM